MDRVCSYLSGSNHAYSPINQPEAVVPFYHRVGLPHDTTGIYNIDTPACVVNGERKENMLSQLEKALGLTAVNGINDTSETYAASLRTGLHGGAQRKMGKNSRRLRLTPTQRVAIVEMDSMQDPQKKPTQAQIARLFGTSRSAICKILRPSSVEKIRQNYAAHFHQARDGYSLQVRGRRSSSDWSQDEDSVSWHADSTAIHRARRCLVEFLVAMPNEPSCRVIPLWLEVNHLGEPSQGHRRLVEAVVKEFGLDLACIDTMRLLYEDEDGDEIVVSSDHELGVAIKHFPPGLYVRMNAKLNRT
eukprot:767961-Hanusia_phi.AAC.3